ncbi:UNVERIFIED_CONTAM: hypothetical protein Sradi_1998000 [Sesamum radiatum]|uniref:Uncharacterized protein n=1 Tax=Sesamum radiatum TaxID=300843 RepID=A0AAW2TG54_SESRA
MATQRRALGRLSARRRGVLRRAFFKRRRKLGEWASPSTNDAVAVVFDARAGGVAQGFRRRRRSGSPAAARELGFEKMRKTRVSHKEKRKGEKERE